MKSKELFGIHDEVERRLQKAQEKKEFKDTGERVGGSAKEKRAISAIINSSDLANLEKDEATAIETIVKDRVWPKVIAENEIDNGVNSGCAYLKHAIRAAYGAKPKSNTHLARKAYIGFAEVLQRALNLCYSITDVKDAIAAIKNLTGSKVPYFFEESMLEQFTSEDLDRKYPNYYVYQILIEKNISRECYNILFKQSEAGVKHWNTAYRHEAVTAEMEAEFRKKHEEKHRLQIAENQNKFLEYSSASFDQLREKRKYWRGIPSNLEQFRQAILSFYEKKIKESEAALEHFPEEFKQREADWSWADIKKRSAEKGRPELIINQPPPLSFIKRTGGLEISQVKEEEIIERFGFKYVEFGNSLSDKEAKEHVRHFLGALVDLFEILNIHQKEINQMGELSIAFASRGVKGSAAHYNKNRRIININRSNGDGSVAHEWMHYLDHLLWQKMKRFDIADQFELASVKLNLLTENDTTRAFKDLCNALKVGDGTPKKIKSYFERNKSITYPGLIKEDIDSTLAHIKSRYSFVFNDSRENSFRDARQVFGYVAHYFDQPGIIVERELTRYSLFYYYSLQMTSKYWSSPQELLARAFETFIFDKLDHLDRCNNYLVNDALYDHPLGIYPTGSERLFFLSKFQAFFSALKKDLSIPAFAPFTERRTEEYIVLGDDKETNEETVESGVVVANDFSELLRLEVSLFKAA